MSERSSSKSGGQSTIGGLDGLRAVAVTMVFLYHAWGHSGFPDASASFGGINVGLTQVIKSGSGGVSILFVLSGFLLSQPFWKEWLCTGPKIDLGRYIVRRLSRIYPAYFVAIVIYALFHDVAHPLWIRSIHIVSHLLLVHNFSEATVFNLSTPLWSVATSFQLYLLLPVIFALLSGLAPKLRKRYFPPLVVFVGGGLVAVSFLVAANLILSAVPIDPRLVSPSGRVIPSSPLTGLAYFCAGTAAGYLFLHFTRSCSASPDIRRYFDVIAIATVIALLVRLFVSPEELGFGAIGWPTLPLLYSVLVLAISLGNVSFGVAALLEMAPIKFIGLVSYSFYLYHDFVLWNVFNRLPQRMLDGSLLDDSVKTVLAYLLTAAVACASYYLVERRFFASKSSPVISFVTRTLRPALPK